MRLEQGARLDVGVGAITFDLNRVDACREPPQWPDARTSSLLAPCASESERTGHVES